MSLSLIEGPPNSGRTGAILARLRASLAADPVLVVPTLEDGDRFERELCESGAPAVLGASIRTFERLFDDVIRVTGAAVAPALSPTQELHVTRSAVARSNLRILARSARRPGFVHALSAVLGETQAACLDPTSIEKGAKQAADSAYLGELAALYRAYVEVRDGLGFGSSHTAAAAATAALRARPDSWGERPVLVYGFDDMTVEQLELLSALAATAPVTVAVTYEDRPALAARARLRQELVERGGRVEETLSPDPANTDSEVLFHLERAFLADRPERRPIDPGLVLIEAAGERGQVEGIAAEVARLIDSGTAPDEIAIVLRDPDREGPLYESVLTGCGIPVAVEAHLPLTRTAIGRGLIGLLRAAVLDGTADELLAFVRAPGVARHSDADWLERAIRRRRLRSATEALEAWNGRALFEIDELRSSSDSRTLLRNLARFARRMSERPYERQAARPTRERRLELRAGEQAAEALEELAEIREIDDGAGEALATLEAMEVDLWPGPAEGHVRVTSPYRIRARRVDALFVASLQEGEFPRGERVESLLSDEQRAELSLPARAETEQEERYLFYVCLSRAIRRLHLCWRSCDDDGAASPRSPLLDDVRDLLDPPRPPPGEPDPLEAEIRRRPLSEVTFGVSEAPSLDELARAVARGGSGDATLPEGLDPNGEGETLRARLDAAAAQNRPAPGPLEVAGVLEALGEREHFGASTLEEYALCSYRWFVQHELAPEGLEPDPEALAEGSLLHAVLEHLYRDPPGTEAAPRPETLRAWRERASELVAELAEPARLAGGDARSAVSRARVGALVDGYLAREAGSPSPLRPDPELLEASFGEREGDVRPALDLGSLRLHGTIDRVDVAPEGNWGLVRDYKSSRKVIPVARFEREGKLQLQLYVLALERLWGRRPLGGVYEPLGATSKRQPRGLLLKDEREALLDGIDLVDRDLLGDEDFEHVLERAAERANEIVTAMHGGEIDRDPLEDRCPSYCRFQAVCRRERAARQEPDRPAEAEEEDEA
jgi:ATP-dependent helicase/DNAse subunit B